MECAYDGGLGERGGITLLADGTAIGTGRVERTVPMTLSGDETCDVGKEAGSPCVIVCRL
jgi:hypothetical protein